MLRTDFFQLPPERQAAYIKDGGTLTDNSAKVIPDSPHFDSAKKVFNRAALSNMAAAVSSDLLLNQGYTLID